MTDAPRWDEASDPTELRLMVGDLHVATVTRWSDSVGETAWWGAALADGTERGIHRTLTEACGAATTAAGVVLAPPQQLLAEFGETAQAEALSTEPTPLSLEERLAKLLAEIVDTPLLTVRDTLNDRPVELYLGSFNQSLSERAAELLEEAGH